MHDIQNEEDIKLLVDDFYDKVLKDEMLKPIFVDIAQLDVAHHLPKMYKFWNSILLGIPGYSGQPFPAHLKFVEHLSPAHFERWLSLFGETVDAHFKGLNAELAKQKARNIANVFQYKMGLFR